MSHLKIGVRAHDLGKREPEELAAALREEGYSAAQLAIPKAIAGIEQYSDITPAKIEQIRRAFEKEEVDIAVFGCYMDLGNPDSHVRAHAVDTLKKSLTWAKELGAHAVGTETAYPHLSEAKRQIWKPYMRDSIERVMEEAVRVDMRFAIEPVWWHPLEDLETTKEILDMIKDPEHLRMIFDASNLLQQPFVNDQENYWNSWLDAVGENIDVLHIKDFSWDESGNYRPEALGAGVIQYDAISRWLHRQSRRIYLLREERNDLYAAPDVEFLKKM